MELPTRDAARITQPVLNVLGEPSAPRFVEGSELVQSWFPEAERLSVPGTGHFLMVQNPIAVADGLRRFYSRRPASPSPAEGLVVGSRDGSGSGR